MRTLLPTLLLAILAASCTPREEDKDEALGEFREIVHWDAKPIGCPSRQEAFFPLPHLQELDGWYGRQLRAAKEQPLCQQDGFDEIYRFSWIPTFHPTVVVRITRQSGTVEMHALRLSGAGGYDPGTKAADTTIVINQGDWRHWMSLVEAARFWVASTAQSDSMVGPDGKVQRWGMMDGAQWILEARRGNEYHAVDRGTPSKAGAHREFRKAGEWLLHRSGLVPDTLVAEY